VRRSLNRPKYKHGCAEEPCGRKPGFCPRRQKARPDTAPTKSRAGRRTIGLPKELTKVLQQHWKEQAAERTRARQLWKDEGWVFAKRTGEALSPNMDYREWKAIWWLPGFVTADCTMPGTRPRRSCCCSVYPSGLSWT
jgi:hypothetical protein